MLPILNQLKNISPALVWEDEKKMEKAVFYLEKKGFLWKDFRKLFYNKDLDIVFTVKDFEKLLNNHHYLEEKIGKTESKEEERSGKIKAAGVLINFLVFLVIMNLFLGWIIFHIIFWIILEGLLVFFLISFVKIRNKIKNVS